MTPVGSVAFGTYYNHPAFSTTVRVSHVNAIGALFVLWFTDVTIKLHTLIDMFHNFSRDIYNQLSYVFSFVPMSVQRKHQQTSADPNIVDVLDVSYLW